MMTSRTRVALRIARFRAGKKGEMMALTGAQFEILIDGKPPSYRDSKPVAIEAAEYLKRRYPNSEVAVKDLQI
jgi:hypothetical protein